MHKEFIVLSRQDAVARNNSPYVNLKVANEEGPKQIMVFDVAKNDGPKVGQLVIFISIRDYQGKNTASRQDMVVGTFPKEEHPLYGLVPRPIAKGAWDECIDRLLSFCKDETLVGFIKESAETLFPQYGKYPAGTSVHHAFPGGLLNHTYQMLHMLEGIYPTYPYKDDLKIERCIIGILFHDWGKMGEYNAEGEKLEDSYLLGHIFLSANHLNNLLRDLGTDKRERKFIVHCILAHHGQMEYGSPVVPCTPEAQLINYLDNISAKADIFTNTGNLEKSFALGTSVVKG